MTSWLTVRLTGSAEHLAKFSELRAYLKQPGMQHTALSFDLAGAQSLVIGLRIILRPQAGLTSVAVEKWLIHEDGQQVLASSVIETISLDLSGFVPGFWLELESDTIERNSAVELWSDVSLLHSIKGKMPFIQPASKAAISAGPAAMLDFDWMFSSPQDGEASTLVRPENLAQMCEAQARVVSVSPPIPIL